MANRLNRRQFPAAASAAGFAALPGLAHAEPPPETTSLHEAGLIKKTPNEIVAGFTGWRFINELKRELKT